MHRLSLRWLLNILKRLFRNLLGTTKVHVQTAIFFLSIISSRLSRCSRRVIHKPFSKEQRSIGRVNASLDPGQISFSDFGQQAHPQKLSSASGYITQQCHTTFSCPSQNHSPISGVNQNTFPDIISSSPIQEVAEPEGEVASLKTSIHFGHPTIHPIFPECIGRYDRNILIPREDTEYKIASLTTTFKPCDDLASWTPHHHPEGALYFFHEGRRVFTEADMYDNASRSTIHSNLNDIDDFLRAHNIQRSSGDDLVLELTKQDDGKFATSYYFANHETRTIYFLDEFDASNLPVWPEVQGVTSPTHIKHEIEVQYWHHCLLFPCALELSHGIVIELRDIITYYITDLMLSSTSTAPYNLENLQRMLRVVNSLPHNVGTEFKGSTCALSALMFVFVRQRFLDFHGQPGARLNRDQSVYGKVTNKRSWLILLLSPVLFYAPEVHLRALEKMWIDGLMRDVMWVQFINKLNTEWQEFTLYATVLLNANVAFLAIQSVDINQDTHRSPAQIFSYISIITSIGSIILGLLLVRQNRTKSKDTAYEVSVFLHRRTSVRLGLETMAIMFSLPYALLMWGMVSFLAAFMFMCFQNSSISARLLVGIIWALIAVLIAWCIWTAWERRPQEFDPVSVPEIEEVEGPSSKDVDHSTQPPKKRWSWPGLIFRRSESCDSDVTVV
ncbi:hypothetical protein BDZ94DRAFT_1247715 [Collybia nuda]|uniref:Uncharacterized protein n=1 Tax=Collybia nuda TaxID=64659 RepID=A0A9P5YFP0_9AGAR|nr:hypothetical protein BDZ94DRAFT_1247715 [Collybia nuda]